MIAIEDEFRDLLLSFLGINRSWIGTTRRICAISVREHQSFNHQRLPVVLRASVVHWWTFGQLE